jgi:type IV pilus assembly protein PilC
MAEHTLTQSREGVKAQPSNCYNYEIRDLKNRLVKGKIEAASLQEAVRKLERVSQSIIVIEKSIPPLPISFRRWNPSGLMLLFKEISIMSRSGLTIQRSIDVLRNQADDSAVKEVLSSIQRALEEGKSFSEALRQFPRVFTKFHIALIKASEEGGFLETSIDYLAAVMEREIKLAQRVRAAGLYPAIVFCIGLIGLAGLMIFVFPQLETLIRDLGVPLPFYTKIVMNVSGDLRKYYLFIPFIVMLIYNIPRIIRFFGGTEYGKFIRERFVKTIPIIGPLIVKSITTHALIVLTALTRSGVKITQSLELAAETCDNHLIGSALQDVSASVMDGSTIADGMRRYPKLFSQMLIAMVMVGEESGELADAFHKTAQLHEIELECALESFTRMIEPVAVGVLGVLIGFMLLSFFVPIYSALNSI